MDDKNRIFKKVHLNILKKNIRSMIRRKLINNIFIHRRGLIPNRRNETLQKLVLRTKITQFYIVGTEKMYYGKDRIKSLSRFTSPKRSTTLMYGY